MAVPQQQPRISTNSLPLPNARFFFVNPSRVRSYLLRLPLFTRLILLAIVAFWLLELQTVWSVTQWGALIPKEVGFGTMYRLNTFPLIHMGFFHMLMDTICLVPLLERFEAEWGTLTTLALFMGRKSLDPFSFPVPVGAKNPSKAKRTVTMVWYLVLGKQKN